MFCVNCGKDVPNGARFCPSCGASQGETVNGPNRVPEQTQETKWEYDDFVWKPAPGSLRISGAGISQQGLIVARADWWAACRASILDKMKSWIDDGWEPIAQVGPDCFEVEVYRVNVVSQMSIIAKVIWIVFSLFTLLLPLLLIFVYTEYAEATGFRVQMRRQVNILNSKSTSKRSDLRLSELG